MMLRIDSCPSCLTKTPAYDYAFPTKGGVAMFYRCPKCGRGWFTTYADDGDTHSFEEGMKLPIITAAMRQAARDPRIRALDGTVTASVIALESEPGERTKGVIRQVVRLVVDERSRLANEMLGMTSKTVQVEMVSSHECQHGLSQREPLPKAALDCILRPLQPRMAADTME